MRVKDIYKQEHKVKIKTKKMRQLESKKRMRIIEEAIKDGSYENWLKFGKRLLGRYNWGKLYEKMNYDIVHELILKILTGVHAKHWNYEKVNINQIMYMNIYGTFCKMNNEMNRKVQTEDNFTGVKVEMDEKGKKKKMKSLDELRHLTLYQVENEMNKKEYSKLFEAHLAGDTGCLELLYGIKNNDYDYKDNKEIERKTGKNIPEIKNTKRRMKTAIQSFRKKGYDRMFNSEGKEIK